MTGELGISRTISTATALDMARLSAKRAAQSANSSKAPSSEAGAEAGAAQSGAATRAAPTRPSANAPDDATISRVNDALLQRNARAEFAFVEGTERMVLKLVDTATNQVLRQVPSQEMIELAQRLDDLRGLLVHKVA